MKLPQFKPAFQTSKYTPEDQKLSLLIFQLPQINQDEFEHLEKQMFEDLNVYATSKFDVTKIHIFCLNISSTKTK